eukprot:TRINITY_DN20393_c0_g1_i2.p1 TRINITY_DN20393_c0_g1~~TRINITY_DN20393_c0_g1_i2.p1  ORF type:complete len:173 (+),score=7.78 TRINITY_DN20393_c0_g1_i2:56-574(+)
MRLQGPLLPFPPCQSQGVHSMACACGGVERHRVLRYDIQNTSGRVLRALVPVLRYRLTMVVLSKASKAFNASSGAPGSPCSGVTLQAAHRIARHRPQAACEGSVHSRAAMGRCRRAVCEQGRLLWEAAGLCCEGYDTSMLVVLAMGRAMEPECELRMVSHRLHVGAYSSSAV